MELSPGAVTKLPAWKLDAVYCQSARKFWTPIPRLRGSILGSDAISMRFAGFMRRRAIWLEEGRVLRARTSDV